MEGFKAVIPIDWVRIFTVEELEIALCGQSTLDLTDWKEHTIYKSYKENSKAVTNFWKAMATYNQDELARFLQFCTGTSRLPLGGFRALESNRGEKSMFCL